MRTTITKPNPVRVKVDLALEMIRQHDADPAASAYHIEWARENLEAVIGSDHSRDVAYLLHEVRRHSYDFLHRTGRRKEDARYRSSRARCNLQAAVQRITRAA